MLHLYGHIKLIFQTELVINVLCIMKISTTGSITYWNNFVKFSTTKWKFVKRVWIWQKLLADIILCKSSSYEVSVKDGKNLFMSSVIRNIFLRRLYWQICDFAQNSIEFFEENIYWEKKEHAVTFQHIFKFADVAHLLKLIYSFKKVMHEKL